MKVAVRQFMRPHGQQQMIHTQLSDDLADDYAALKAKGGEFQAEVLPGGMVYVSINVPEFEDDLDNRLVDKGPQVQIEMEDMLLSMQWKRELLRLREEEKREAEKENADEG